MGAYNGVDGDSASITMSTVIISALENIPIRQDMAMTGSLNVRGKVLPIGGVTAKLEAAAEAGIKIALIPKDNEKDVMIDRKYYDMMDIYTVENLRDVFEYAFVDCPKKEQYLEQLLPLTEGGKSTAHKIVPPPKYEYREPVPTEEPVKAEPEPVIVSSEEPAPAPITGEPAPQ